MPEAPVPFFAVEDLLLVASSLGLWATALFAATKVGSIDHFYRLAAPLERLHYARLRDDLRFAEATDADFAEMVRGLGELDAASRREVVSRIVFRRRAPRGCTIARNAEGALVSMQWLFRPADEAAKQAWFRARYASLRPDEVLIENIFIYPRFRAAGMFPTVNHGVLEQARREGFRTCAAYIRKDNVPSLNAYLDLGFRLQRLLTGYTLAGTSWRTA
jgi:hypothetical protein